MKSESREQIVEEILTRGVKEVVGEEISLRLRDHQPIRVKYGIDPTAPEIHLGHAVALHKLKLIQQLGHKVILIVGDYTASIGDPTGRTRARQQLSPEHVQQNVREFTNQISKVLPLRGVEVRYQSEWYNRFSLHDVIDLLSKVSSQQLLGHGTFRERHESGHHLGMQEVIYPLLQAYDSVMVKADLEFGGIDQKFNFLITRQLQERFHQQPESAILLKYLPGINGEEKMSKSQNNYISLRESAKEMYYKVMGIPDSVMSDYFELATDISEPEIKNFFNSLNRREVHPLDLKKRLAQTICLMFHSDEETRVAAEEFFKVVQRKQAPENIGTFLSERTSLPLIDFLVESKMANSRSDARRLISSKGIKVNNQTVEEITYVLNPREKPIVSRANKTFVRLQNKK